MLSAIRAPELSGANFPGSPLADTTSSPKRPGVDARSILMQLEKRVSLSARITEPGAVLKSNCRSFTSRRNDSGLYAQYPKALAKARSFGLRMTSITLAPILFNNAQRHLPILPHPKIAQRQSTRVLRK